MRFRFCGDADCPDWVLAQINTFSKMGLCELTNLIQIVMESLLTQNNLAENITNIAEEVKLDVGDCKAAISALDFILTSSASYAVTESFLSNELQQIGLQHKHALTLCKVYSDNKEQLISKLADESLKFTKMVNHNCHSNGSDIFFDFETYDLIRDLSEKYSVQMDAEHLDILINDLKEAYEVMESANIT